MGPLGALLFMSWLGIRVLPSRVVKLEEIETIKAALTAGKSIDRRHPLFYLEFPGCNKDLILFEHLQPPNSPLLRYNHDCESQLNTLLKVTNFGKLWFNVSYHDAVVQFPNFLNLSFSGIRPIRGSCRIPIP